MKPEFELTMVQVTTAVNVTRSPAVSTVPVAGTIESTAMKSVVGVVGPLLPQLAIRRRLHRKSRLRIVRLLTVSPVVMNTHD